jgi:hypothetical protein
MLLVVHAYVFHMLFREILAAVTIGLILMVLVRITRKNEEDDYRERNLCGLVAVRSSMMNPKRERMRQT